jgi:hypothetical protein
MQQQNVSARPQVIKVSKPFYLASYIASYIALSIISIVIIVMAGMTGSSPDISEEMVVSLMGIILLAVAIGIFNVVIGCLILFKSWKAIQDGQQRTTPGKAVGFCFIPFFNLYWIFQAYWGFAKDYNAFIARNNLNVKKLSEGIFLANCILSILLPGLISFIFDCLVINQQCDGINNLANSN